MVPCAHIYRDGQLQAALPLSKKKWPTFLKTLSEHTQSAQPDACSLGASCLTAWRVLYSAFAALLWKLRIVASRLLRSYVL